MPLDLGSMNPAQIQFLMQVLQRNQQQAPVGMPGGLSPQQALMQQLQNPPPSPMQQVLQQLQQIQQAQQQQGQQQSGGNPLLQQISPQLLALLRGRPG